jgi:hypothetical protein
VQQDQDSLGIITDDEVIVRGAFDPRSAKAATGNIRSSIIPKEHLLTGQLSVWRLDPPGIAINDLAARLDSIPGQSLYALCGLPAGTIRSISRDSDRAFSVVDECECDQEGNKHPAHAHIALCKSLVAQGLGKDHPDFEQVRTELYFKLKSSLVWERTA